MTKVFDLKPGDMVWLMYKDKPTIGFIKSAWYTEFLSSCDHDSLITNELYTVIEHKDDKYSLGTYKKELLFPDKQSLLKSL
jgi:hypothetical protein